uniref:PAXIP1-associated glutamate-rich protein 1 n=1 Tax=Myxine glutinosa TaxID=7769 RepID=UPI00358EA1AD
MNVERRDEVKHTDRQRVTYPDTRAPEHGARDEETANGIRGHVDEDSNKDRDSDSEWSVGPSEDGLGDPVSWTPEPALIPDLIGRLVRDGVLPLVAETLPRRPQTPEAPPPEQSRPEEAEPQPEFSPPERMEMSAFDFSEERQPETRPHELLPRRVAGTRQARRRPSLDRLLLDLARERRREQEDEEETETTN